ncbi:hypothetical protein [Sphingomonas sp. SUN039]|uniref:hypothetical protein n=1 Tax=Sphingomonas sp. SUN039 TaxID=2937787 RepID=UPI002164B341|nr:hypothetical protein [Sphingomonas sp. SUN039]UVO54316.1 hypothetical protein M0209_09360 [Sphingomonas sp. SUN039]
METTLTDPGPYETAAGIAQSIAVNVLSEQVADLTDPAFAALGLDSASGTQDAYYKQILTALTAIEGDLAAITAKMNALSAGIDKIEAQLTQISSQITDAELQAALLQYAQNLNVVEQNYQTFAAAIVGMANATTFEQGTNSLFDLFQATNVDAVATAMRNIHDLLVGSGELRGIISYQAVEVTQAYAKVAADPAQTTRVINTDPALAGLWFASFPDASMILDALPGVLSDTFGKVIVPALTAALACQVKGLSFLCAAWGGTINASSLTTVTADTQAIIGAMGTLFAGMPVDDLAAIAMKNYATPVPLSAQSAQWALQGDTVGSPFDNDWVFWNVGPPPDLPNSGPRAGLVATPWAYGIRPSFSVENEGGNMVENPDGSFTNCQYAAYPVPFSYVSTPTQNGVGMPANFKAFLATLPAAS